MDLPQQQPFELPCDAIGRVMVESAGLELADEAGGVAGEGEDRFGTHRVRLLRQRRGAATPLAVVGTLAQLADLVLTHEENIAGHLAEAAGDEAEPVAELDERSEEHTSELQSLMRISYAVFCLKKK